LSGVGSGENLDVALGAAMAVLPGVGLLSLVWLVGLYALAISVTCPREFAPAQHTETTTPIRRLRLRSVES
jgi:hypothetical protein